MYGLLDLKSDLEWNGAPLSFLLSSLNHLFPALCLGNESFAKPPSTQALQRNYKLPEPGLFRWMRLVSSLLLCLYPFNPLSSCSNTVFSIKEQVGRENSTTLPLLDTQFLLVQWIHLTNSDKDIFFRKWMAYSEEPNTRGPQHMTLQGSGRIKPEILVLLFSTPLAKRGHQDRMWGENLHSLRLGTVDFWTDKV